MHIVLTIVPIFIVVVIGWIIHRKGFTPNAFLIPANRLVYYVAIPAMVFQSISKSVLSQWSKPGVIMMTLAAALLVYLVAWFICRVSRMRRSVRASFIQSAGHGNLGYIGLAVAFYYLDGEGMANASLVAGFLMILQNFLSIIALQGYSAQGQSASMIRVFAGNIIGNPVIISVLSGMMVSIMGLTIPPIIDRSLTILKGMALPVALLIIGATISFGQIRRYRFHVLAAGILKLFFMPALGCLLYWICGLGFKDSLPGLIMLACPTATTSYVMAKMMHADADLAVAAISASTLASVFTFILWLQIASG
ncbi:MAG: AEC family transporter [Desulfobacteraceae bacterium]|nr:AEC family transporter [Desulfobacteraceae bacterium]